MKGLTHRNTVWMAEWGNDRVWVVPLFIPPTGDVTCEMKWGWFREHEYTGWANPHGSFLSAHEALRDAENTINQERLDRAQKAMEAYQELLQLYKDNPGLI